MLTKTRSYHTIYYYYQCQPLNTIYRLPFNNIDSHTIINTHQNMYFINHDHSSNIYGCYRTKFVLSGAKNDCSNIGDFLRLLPNADKFLHSLPILAFHTSHTRKLRYEKSYKIQLRLLLSITLETKFTLFCCCLSS